MNIPRINSQINANIEYQLIKWLKSTSFTSFYEEISKRVIGQEELQTVLAGIWAYINSVVYGAPRCGNRHNMLIAAPSGCGKTETYRALRDYFSDKVPGFMVTIYDVSNLTAAGFKGQEPSDILTPFYQAGIANPIGICFLDEFDKKISPAFSGSGENVNMEVQGQLLTLIEGGDIYNKRGSRINTENMLFIGVGSFNAFRESRMNTKKTIGLTADREEENKKYEYYAPLSAEDMVAAGGSWELLGRFSSVINYRKLNEDAIRLIIDKVMQTEADVIGADLDLAESVVEELVDMAIESKFGCRFIYSKLHETIMLAYTQALFNMPDESSIMIHIKGIGDATYEFRSITDEDRLSEAEYIESLLRKRVESTGESDSWDSDLLGIWA